jgi:hypothetical protein
MMNPRGAETDDQGRNDGSARRVPVFKEQGLSSHSFYYYRSACKHDDDSLFPEVQQMPKGDSAPGFQIVIFCPLRGKK